jgi:hypothetical protein
MCHGSRSARRHHSVTSEKPLREEVVMTAYTPHTPPMWRRVFSLPHTRLGWWAVGLSAVSVPLFL